MQDLLDRVGASLRAWRGDSELIFEQLWHDRQDADIGKGWGKKRTQLRTEGAARGWKMIGRRSATQTCFGSSQDIIGATETGEW